MLDSEPKTEMTKRSVRWSPGTGMLISALLWILFSLFLFTLIFGATRWDQVHTDNDTISALAQGYDIEIADDARGEVAFARLNFLVHRGRLDEALRWSEDLSQWQKAPRPVIDGHDTLEGAQSPPLPARALYNMGNGRLRHAFEMLEQSRLDKAPQSVRLAQDYYTRALRLEPNFWDARYNLDIATRLVRHLPRALIDEDDEESDADPKELWTQLPGLPRGLP